MHQALSEGRDPLELRADPAGLAPERLLVFELTFGVQKFASAVAKVPGLESIGAEDLEGDEEDKNPALYLMVPDVAALRQIVSLWNRFQAGRALGPGLTPWRDLFAQLRAVRPWGPQDRVSEDDFEILARERADPRAMVRIELELVFRHELAIVEHEALVALQAVGGELVSKARIDGAGYHTLLVDVPESELRRILARGREGLVAAEAVMHIRPQSVVDPTLFEIGREPTQEQAAAASESIPGGDPIAAVFDAVPLTGHPRLNARMSVDDPFDLEPSAVGIRRHGTAMASAVIHGDLAGAPTSRLDRKISFVNVMYAPGDPGQDERFPDRLPADIFHQAVSRMKSGGEPTAPGVIIINASSGDSNKPFNGRMSGWARVVDYLSHAYGVLFVISAGNHLDDLVTAGVNTIEFERLNVDQKARCALRASGAAMVRRRILAPAESMNAISVGALHADNIAPGALPALTFDIWRDTGLCTISSGLGPGLDNSVKPDVLAPGGRHHVRLLPTADGHRLSPVTTSSRLFGGIVVATPPASTAVTLDATTHSVGTSVAAATTTGIAARAHEAMEAAYDDFLTISGAQRALFLKALIVHCARWTTARDLIIQVLGPADSKQNVRQKDNVRRYLGYGAIDAAMMLNCANDRATLWAVGTLQREKSARFSLPLPAVMSGKPQLHEISATVAWFAPPKVGATNYRGIRLKLKESESSTAMLAVKATGAQPDTNQTHRGTVIHRRWEGQQAAAFAADANFELTVQREPDEIGDPANYAIVVTIKMSGVAGIYEQVRSRVALKPKVRVRV